MILSLCHLTCAIGRLHAVKYFDVKLSVVDSCFRGLNFAVSSGASVVSVVK